MSSTESFGLDILLLPLAVLVLAAAGVADAVARRLPRTATLSAADELENRLRERVQDELQQAPARYRQASSLSRASSDLLEALARAQAIRRGLEAEPAVHAVAQQWHRRSLSEAVGAVERAERLASRGQIADAVRLARRGDRLMTEAAYDAHRRLADAQHAVVADVTTSAIQALGYAVQRAEESRTVAVWGRKGQRTLAAVIAHGRLQLDMAGFDGIECCAESERLLGELRSRGLELRREQRVVHARREGGALITRALRHPHARAMTPAAALLRTVNTEVTAAPSAAHRRAAAGPATHTSYDRARAWLWMQRAETAASLNG